MKWKKDKHENDLKSPLIVEKILKENCFPKKAPLVITSSSADEEDMELIYDDDSDRESEEKIEIRLGD